MDTVNVIVEIPRFSQNKYEYDHESDTIKLDRHLLVAMGYPAEYGFIPDTLGGDGDPLDVLVITEFPTFPGCLIESKILGMCIMTDENGRDEKLIAVPSYDKNWKSATDITDVPERDSRSYSPLFHGLQGPRRGQVGQSRKLRRTRRGVESAPGRARRVRGRRRHSI